MFRSSKQLAAAGLRVGCSRTPHGRLLSPALSPTIAIRGLVHTEIITKPLLQSYTFRSSSSTPAHRTNGVLPCVTAAYGLPGQISATERGGARVPLRGKLHVDVMLRTLSTGPFSGPFNGKPNKPETKTTSPAGNNGNKPQTGGKTRPSVINRFIDPPEDGLTRYPTLRSPQGVLRGMDYMGTVVFALSGTVTAGNAGMDLLGCCIVGTITATGGGTVRDLLLGNTPVFWMGETEYLWMCLVTTMLVFFSWSYLTEQGFRDDIELLNWADAMGIGAFCCIGAQAGIRKGLSPIVCILCGMLTSSFGGVIRDVLCQRPPRILHSHAEIYASTALLGSTVYVGSKIAGFSPMAKITAGFIAGSGLRVLAFKTDIRLPTWAEASSKHAIADANTEAEKTHENTRCETS